MTIATEADGFCIICRSNDVATVNKLLCEVVNYWVDIKSGIFVPDKGFFVVGRYDNWAWWAINAGCGADVWGCIGSVDWIVARGWWFKIAVNDWSVHGDFGWSSRDRFVSTYFD